MPGLRCESYARLFERAIFSRARAARPMLLKLNCGYLFSKMS